MAGNSSAAASGQPVDDAGRIEGAPLKLGSFRFWFTGQRWEWSDEVYQMHGYEPGAVVVTTELILSHKHPADRLHVHDLLDQALHTAESFSSRHRFFDVDGTLHDAIVVGDRLFDDGGAVIGTEGYYIDLAATLNDSRQDALDEALLEIVEARAEIEQAKGVLMYVYRINADQAFRLMRWRSQETNTKLRTLALELVAELGSQPALPTVIQRAFDHLLLTVHRRTSGD